MLSLVNCCGAHQVSSMHSGTEPPELKRKVRVTKSGNSELQFSIVSELIVDL